MRQHHSVEARLTGVWLVEVQGQTMTSAPRHVHARRHGVLVAAVIIMLVHLIRQIP